MRDVQESGAAGHHVRDAERLVDQISRKGPAGNQPAPGGAVALVTEAPVSSAIISVPAAASTRVAFRTERVRDSTKVDARACRWCRSWSRRSTIDRRPTRSTTSTVVSFGTDDALVGAIQNSIRSRLQQGALVIPRLPQVAIKIMQMSQEVDLDMGEVTGLIMTDPVLAARLLSVANSAAYSGTAQIGGLNQGSRASASRRSRISCSPSRSSRRCSSGTTGKSNRAILRAVVAALARLGAGVRGALEGDRSRARERVPDRAAPRDGDADDRQCGRGVPPRRTKARSCRTRRWRSWCWNSTRRWAPTCSPVGHAAAIVDAAEGHHRYRSSSGNATAHQMILAANLICSHLQLGGTPREISFTTERVFQDRGAQRPRQDGADPRGGRERHAVADVRLPEAGRVARTAEGSLARVIAPGRSAASSRSTRDAGARSRSRHRASPCRRAAACGPRRRHHAQRPRTHRASRQIEDLDRHGCVD